MFSSQKTFEKHPIPVRWSFSVKNIQLMVSSKETSQGTHLLAVRKVAVMGLLTPTDNLLRSHRVSHMHDFTSKRCTIHFSSINLI
jgi:hypothetical protein